MRGPWRGRCRVLVSVIISGKGYNSVYFFRVFGVGLRIFILLLCCGGGGVRVQGSGGSWVEDFGEFGGMGGG